MRAFCDSREMGIPTGSVCSASPETDRFTVEQTGESAWIYELPSGLVAVVAPAKLTVRIPGHFDYGPRIEATVG